MLTGIFARDAIRLTLFHAAMKAAHSAKEEAETLVAEGIEQATVLVLKEETRKQYQLAQALYLEFCEHYRKAYKG